MQQMRFRDLLGRADEETLQELVGRSSVAVLGALDERLTSPMELRRICLELHSPLELLRSSSSRSLLLQHLSSEDASELASLLSLDTENPFESLSGFRMHKGSSLEHQLTTYFDVEVPPSGNAVGIVPTESIAPQYGLFSHQRNALMQVLSHLQSQRPMVLLHMPTGAGKTRTAIHAVSEILRKNAPGLVLWLAYSEELCEQSASDFSKAWNLTGDRRVEIYRFWGASGGPEIDEIRDGFMVAGLGKLYARALRDGNFLARLADRTRLVVLDEAHQATAPSYRYLLDTLLSRSIKTGLLGLTATPGRTWNEPEVDEELAEVFAKQKVTLTVPGYDSPIEYLTENGYLARTITTSLPYESGKALDQAQIRQLADALEVPVSVLEDLASDTQRNLAIVSATEDLARRHTRIIVFAATVAHSKLLATALRARGLQASVVSSETTAHERAQILDYYRSAAPEPQVLCNFGVLTTGFDAPATSGVVIARPSKSLVLYSQMVGRATRGPAVGGNEVAEVLTITDTRLPGFASMVEAFNNWEDIWDD